MSIFSFIGHLFSDLFSASKRAWNHLPSNVQAGLLNGSGILNIISQFVDQDPKQVIATIQVNYPDENLEAIYSGLVDIAKFYNILPAVVPADLEGVVALIQGYLKKTESASWPKVVFGAAAVLADTLTGTSAPFEVVASLLQFVYSNFIKGSDIKLAPAVDAAAVIIDNVAPGSEASKIVDKAKQIVAA